MIGPGDLVVATRNGVSTRNGPNMVPMAGKTYRVASVYKMCYGLGVTLVGMDHSPYQGYFLYLDPSCAAYCFTGAREPGWYFRKVKPATKKFTEMIQQATKRHEKRQRERVER